MDSMTNPLRQYFRRPAVYLKLPSGGKGYTPEVLTMPENGEIPVYPMTAIDEITVRTPDALFNGVAIAELIKSCVPAIHDPWKVNSIDFDAILIAIKAAGGSGELEIESLCPNCNEEAKYALNLMRVLATLEAGDYTSPLVINELQFKFRPLTYKEMNEAAIGQFEVQRIFNAAAQKETDEERNKVTQEAFKQVTELTMKLLTQGIEFIKTPNAMVTEKEFILDFLRNCDKTVYLKVRDHSAELRMKTEMKPLDVKCVNCNHEYKQPFTLNPSDFFE
jgi:hypothetical protein